MATRRWMGPLRGPAGAVVAGFAVSRAAYYAIGVRFNALTLDTGPQFVDPQLLRHDLLESLWYLHTQPPLFNGLLGIVLKLSGDHYGEALHAIFVALGLLLALGLYRLIVRLGVRPWPAAALALAFSVTPPAVLYENWFYIDHVVAVALVWAAVFVHRFVQSGRTVDATVAFGLLGGVVLSRTLFHLVFLVAAVVLLWLVQPGRRRRVLAAAAVPLALCVAVYVKTLVQFDTFGATTCSGINVSRITTLRIDFARRIELMRQGELSEFATTLPGDLPRKRPELFEQEPVRGHAILDRPTKSTSGATNLDHAAMLDICGEYMDDAITSVRKDPGAVRNGAQAATMIFWRPSSQYFFFSRPSEKSRARIRHIDDVYTRALGQLREPEVTAETSVAPSGSPDHLLEVAWLVVAGYVLTAWWTVRSVLRERTARAFSATTVTVAFVVLTAAYVTLAGSLLELGENNRFRYIVDPLVFAAFVGLGSAWLRERGGLRRRPRGGR